MWLCGPQKQFTPWLSAPSQAIGERISLKLHLLKLPIPYPLGQAHQESLPQPQEGTSRVGLGPSQDPAHHTAHEEGTVELQQ